MSISLYPPPLSILAHLGEWQSFAPGLTRLNRALELLGHPHQQYPHIIVGGTNGKGSVSYQLAQCAQAKVGVLISPHLLDIRERIIIDQCIVPDTVWHDAYHVICQQVPEQERQFSYFEWVFLLAVVIFQHQQVDWAVFEVGLGGRLDACNTLDPQLSIVTSIDLDHTPLLGSTKACIAKEKVAIARAGRPLLLPRSVAQLPGISEQIADIGATPILIEDQMNTVEQQQQAMIKEVCHYFRWPTPQRLLTLPARKEILTSPNHEPIYLDCAHNVAAWRQTRSWLMDNNTHPTVMVTSLSGHRSPQELLAIFEPIIHNIKLWISGFEQELPVDAWPTAMPTISTKQLDTLLDSPLLVCGSMYMVGNWLKWYVTCDQIKAKTSVLHPLLQQVLTVQPIVLDCT